MTLRKTGQREQARAVSNIPAARSLTTSKSGWFSWDNLVSFDAAAYGYRGGIRHTVKKRIWYTWADVVFVFVLVGWYSHVHTDNADATLTFDFDDKSSVSKADGDGWHMCGSGYARLL